MPDYQKLYSILFNAITDALEELSKAIYGLAAEGLKAAQQTTEALYMEA